MLPTPANSWCRHGLQRPGTERVTPCLPGRLQRALRLRDTGARRRWGVAHCEPNQRRGGKPGPGLQGRQRRSGSP